MKCKACRHEVPRFDTRELCKHCGWMFDHIDALACDIRGIHDDMREYGIPLGSANQEQDEYDE